MADTRDALNEIAMDIADEAWYRWETPTRDEITIDLRDGLDLTDEVTVPDALVNHAAQLVAERIAWLDANGTRICPSCRAPSTDCCCT